MKSQVVTVTLLNEKSTHGMIPGSVEEAIEKVKELYHEQEVCLDEFLENVSIEGLSINDVVKVYAELFKHIENDRVYRVREEGDIEPITSGLGKSEYQNDFRVLAESIGGTVIEMDTESSSYLDPTIDFHRSEALGMTDMGKE